MVGGGPADRDGPGPLAAALEPGHQHGRLGRAVDADEPPAARGPPADLFRAGRLPAGHHQPYAGQPGRVQQRQDRRRQHHHVDGLLGADPVQPGRVCPLGVTGEHDGATGGERGEQVGHRRVEPDRGERQAAGRGVDAGELRDPGDLLGQRPVLDHRPLGPPGRPRREHHVRGGGQRGGRRLPARGRSGDVPHGAAGERLDGGLRHDDAQAGLGGQLAQPPRGSAGSSGTYPAPAACTPSSATTRSGRRSTQTPTRSSGATPSARSDAARAAARPTRSA